MAHQYDRWHQLFTVRDKNGKKLVPSTTGLDTDTFRAVQDLAILINDEEYRYSSQTLTPIQDSGTGNYTGQWRAYIDEEQTDLERILTFQCEVDFGDPYSGTQPNIIHSDKTNDRLSPSLDWSDDD